MFPPEKQVSPVADQLRQILASAPWARVGLGLPVVSIFLILLTIYMNIHNSTSIVKLGCRGEAQSETMKEA